MFTVDERIGFIRGVRGGHRQRRRWKGLRPWWSSLPGLTGARAIVKGLRAVSDFEWEFQMNNLNRGLAGEIETLYLMASPKYSFLSSRGVREIASFGGSVDDYVPAAGGANARADCTQRARFSSKAKGDRKWTFWY